MNLKHLEFQRLLKELQFVEYDYLYQSEIIKECDKEFYTSIDNILEKYPELKEIYYNKSDLNSQIISSNISPKLSESNNSIIIDNSNHKKIYHSIVKVTHPDKIKNKKLNNLYIEASEAYENNDIISLYKVCSDLNIEFDIPNNLYFEIKEKIDSIKNRIKFIENTFTYKWFKSKSNLEKNKILMEFIKHKIG